MFENPRRGRQARNFTTNVPKILDLKSSSEQIFSENCRCVPLSIVWNMCENLHYESVYFKELHNEDSTSKNTIDRQYTEWGQL